MDTCKHCGRKIEVDDGLGDVPVMHLDTTDTSYYCPDQGLGSDYPEDAQYHEP